MSCFLLTMRGQRTPVRQQLRREAMHHHDLHFVAGTEGCTGISFSKWHGWWTEAARFAAVVPSLHAVCKVDDDTVVQLPNLLTAAARLATRAGHVGAPRFVAGSFAFAGYRVEQGLLCGFDWSKNGGNWGGQRCAERGATRPFIFPLGSVQLLSPAVLTALPLAHMPPPVRLNLNGGDQFHEDVALGYMLARAEEARTSLDKPTRFIDMGRSGRVANLGCLVANGTVRSAAGSDHRTAACCAHDAPCCARVPVRAPTQWMYMAPTIQSIVRHHVKFERGFSYVDRVMRGCTSFDPYVCQRRTGAS
jgi:hypothetical protein